MINVIDLFAGAGGLSYGFLLTGEYRIIAAAEINENARKTYEKNIAKDVDGFEFIENVVGYNFIELNKRLANSIDVVIGGPPCQGFSNANRQKNHLISMNNGLIKEFFRAIRQIKPKAFVMENVSMLKSDTHRFYESTKDIKEINDLIEKGHPISKREDYLLISGETYEGINIQQLLEMDLEDILLPEPLRRLLSVLRKNISNEKRLPNFLIKKSKSIKKMIDSYIVENEETISIVKRNFIDRLIQIEEAVKNDNPKNIMDELNYIVEIQKVIECIKEITENGLIGRYEYSEKKGLRFVVNSYSVIDYVNAILGDNYIQQGDIVNAEWFGVPQERRRYFIIGIRRDIFESKGINLSLPSEPEDLEFTSVGDAILDLVPYKAGYDSRYSPLQYISQEKIGGYAKRMRVGSDSVKNHFTTKTTEKALARFKKIKQGKNFHSLSIEDKDTYSKPERTQNTIYLRLDPNKPSGTVVNVRKSMWIHPLKDRAITVREAARLQSFPDNFEFVGSKDSQYQQVGNAVPPLLAKGIAEIVLEFVK